MCVLLHRILDAAVAVAEVHGMPDVSEHLPVRLAAQHRVWLPAFILFCQAVLEVHELLKKRRVHDLELGVHVHVPEGETRFKRIRTVTGGWQMGHGIHHM
jgi:hypothetical protein